eukprot:jgi/Mesen1/7151/ME000037S06513
MTSICLFQAAPAIFPSSGLSRNQPLRTSLASSSCHVAPLRLSKSSARSAPGPGGAVRASAQQNGAPKGSSPSGSAVARLVNGAVSEGPDLSVTVNGLKLPNPFVIGSGPPGTNYTVMKKAFDEGWGAVICKTLSLDSSKVVNVTPRYAKLRAPGSRDVIGWENIELISDRPFETMLEELAQLKREYPERVLIASIMEEYNRPAWEEVIRRVEATGVDGLEINFSCPHGMPERRMGMAMGQDCELLAEVCSWINATATVPVWAKMTPNITDITLGVAAINTITSVMGINLDTLRPEPCVQGYTTPGGYSSKAVRPIALAKVMAIAQMMRREFPADRSLSGIGGVESGDSAAEFLLLGANSVQVGPPHVNLVETTGRLRVHSLEYFTTHMELVRMQREALEKRRVARTGLASDKDWTGEGFVAETETMVSNA